MLQAISYIAIAIFLFNAYKSKRQKYIKFLALFFLVFGLVAFLILVISAITQMFFRWTQSRKPLTYPRGAGVFGSLVCARKIQMVIKL